MDYSISENKKYQADALKSAELNFPISEQNVEEEKLKSRFLHLRW